MTGEFARVAPRLARAHAAERRRLFDGISRCAQGGWHANGAGPCFSSPWEAIGYRNVEDRQALDGTNVQRFAVRDEPLRRRLLWRLGERDEP